MKPNKLLCFIYKKSLFK